MSLVKDYMPCPHCDPFGECFRHAPHCPLRKPLLPTLLRPCTTPGHIYAFTTTPPMCDQCTTPDACCTPIDLATQEPPTVPDTNPKAARAAADDKLRLELVETALTHPLARVMAHGADKYGVRNWRTQPIYLRTYVAAMRRHTDAIADGEWFDPDSGEPHAAHVAACSQVILDARAHGTLTDDTAYAEGGVPGGVAANVEGGVKHPDSALCTADCGIGRTHAVGVHRELAAVSLCPLGGGCPVPGGCATPCKPMPYAGVDTPRSGR